MSRGSYILLVQVLVLVLVLVLNSKNVAILLVVLNSKKKNDVIFRISLILTILKQSLELQRKLLKLICCKWKIKTIF